MLVTYILSIIQSIFYPVDIKVYLNTFPLLVFYFAMAGIFKYTINIH